MTALRVAGLTKSYRGFLAVKDVSFSLAPGEMLALIGPNGAGKTTCFNMINGQIAPTSGTVHIFDRRADGLGPRAVGRLGVGRTFQVAATFGSMTLVENVQMALLARHGELWPSFRWAARRRRNEALAMLERVGMADQADRLTAEIAYGDLKRLDLAIALSSEPRLLLMDEPAGGMAPSERRGLMELAERIARERNIGVLFTEHDMDVVFGHADRLLVLNRGELIAEGRPAEVRAREDVRRVYLGAGALEGGLR
ncbi:MAG: ABC transporter ATP-binding protein [Hyphomicrobiales bacterium]|nr:ABC transporter ATP-binding protein [Hyphomicrobiales bacterium]